LYPVLLDVEGAGADPVAALNTVRGRIRAIPRRGVGYGLARYLHPDADLRRELESVPAPEIAFNYFGRLDVGPRAGETVEPPAAGPTRSPQQTRSHLLELNARVEGGQLHLDIAYSPLLIAGSTVATLADDWIRALRALIASDRPPDYSPTDFSDVDLSDEQLAKVLAEVEANASL
jgi:non-ribosomal peptide synthase protein (TIGR01720 family)